MMNTCLKTAGTKKDMNILISIIRKVKNIRLSASSYGRAFVFLFSLVIAGSLLMYYVERGSNAQFASLEDSFWWAVVTIATVGYGDKYPQTTAGHLIAAVVMIGGIGSFGFIAGTALDNLLKKGQGRMKIKFEDHFVICSYNFKVPSIVKEIKNELAHCRIVLVADREENPLAGEESVYFVRGDSAREATLEQANAGKARTVIVMAEQTMEDNLADAHSVLTTLAVKELNPACRLVAESLVPENSHHLIHAGADEIVCIGDITAKLVSRTSIHQGMTQLISELMSNSTGCELYSALIPDYLLSQCFAEASTDLRQKGAILVGVYRQGELSVNPPPEYTLQKEDLLIYIAQDKII